VTKDKSAMATEYARNGVFFGRFFDIFQNFLLLKEPRYSNTNASKVKTIIVYRWPGLRFSKRSGIGKYINTIGGHKKRFCQRDLQVEEYLFFSPAVSLLLRKHIYFTNLSGIRCLNINFF
jgi:hypothetical protein